MSYRREKEYDNSNRIALWENDDQREGKRDPELKGSATEIECPCCGEKSDYWVSLWKNDKGGKAPVQSGKVEPKENRKTSRTPPRREERTRREEPRRRDESSRDDLDSEIPF